MRAASFVVPGDHPSLPGHFPGHPIVPGVVLLDHVLALLGIPVRALDGVKFTAAVLPGETVEVAAETQPGRIRFVATRAGQVVLRGTALT